MAFRALPLGDDPTVEEFRAWLAQFDDADREGRITRKELQRVLQGLNEWFARWKVRSGLRAAAGPTKANRAGIAAGNEEIAELFADAQRNLHGKIIWLGSYEYSPRPSSSGTTDFTEHR